MSLLLLQTCAKTKLLRVTSWKGGTTAAPTGEARATESASATPVLGAAGKEGKNGGFDTNNPGWSPLFLSLFCFSPFFILSSQHVFRSSSSPCHFHRPLSTTTTNHNTAGAIRRPNETSANGGPLHGGWTTVRVSKMSIGSSASVCVCVCVCVCRTIWLGRDFVSFSFWKKPEHTQKEGVFVVCFALLPITHTHNTNHI
jgi:hypothetical protein